MCESLHFGTFKTLYKGFGLNSKVSCRFCVNSSLTFWRATSTVDAPKARLAMILIMVHSLHCHDLDCLIMLDLMLESTKLAIREIMSFVESWKCFGYKRMCTCVGRLDSVRQASSNALPIQLCREERIIWQIFRFQCFDWHSPFSR